MQPLAAPPPTAATLPDLLRRLRRARRLTQGEAALAAGVSRVTLARWESGAHKPRLPELEAVLAALGAGPRERSLARSLLGTPGALAEARAQVRRLAERAGLEGLPSGGDLLRAMRRRGGLGVDEAASGAGVRAWTLRRWEAGEAWPDPARLHALCWALGAEAGEVVALTVGPFAGAAAPLPEASGGEAHERLDGLLDDLRGRIAAGDFALMDLHCLTLQARAWRLAVGGDAGRRLLSRAYQIHAMALSFRGHLQEAKRLALRAMEVWPDALPREPIWYYCGVLVAQGFYDGGPERGGGLGKGVWGARRGRETLRPLLDAVSPRTDAAWGGLEVWILSEMALCLAQEGATDEALAAGEAACRIAERKATPAEGDRRRNALAGLLLKSGRPADALARLDGVAGTTPYHATEMALVRAEASLGVGSPASAHDWVGEAQRLIRRHDLAHLQGRADALARRL